MYSPVRKAPVIPAAHRTTPRAPWSIRLERMASFEKNPANGGIAASASAPTRKAR